MPRSQINLISGELAADPNVRVSQRGNTYTTFPLRVRQRQFNSRGAQEREDTIEFLCFGITAENMAACSAGDVVTVTYNVNIDENEGNEGQVFRNVKLMVGELLFWGFPPQRSEVAPPLLAATFGTCVGEVVSDNVVREDKEGELRFNLLLEVTEEWRRRDNFGDEEIERKQAVWPVRGYPELVGSDSAAPDLAKGDIVLVNYIVTGSEYETRDGAKRIANHVYANELVAFGNSAAEDRDVFATDPRPPSNIDDLPWGTE